MPPDDSSFNHVGLCVRDVDLSRRFYEQLLGFTFVRSLSVPDSATAGLLRLAPPVGLSAVYLQRDGFVLELLHYADHGVVPSAGSRTMDLTGLTHISLSVASLDDVLARVPSFGGEVLSDTLIPGVAVLIRDPDGQMVELLARQA